MRRKLLPLLFLSVIVSAQHLKAQSLISWQDLLNKETSSSFERIAYGPDSLQFGDLWLPDHKNPKATIILVHGGCWRSIYPGTELTSPMAEALAKQGFAVWNITYRRLGHDGGGYPGTFKDIAAAADHLVTLAETHPVQTDYIIASGHSAGGHLANWLAARKNLPADNPLYEASPLRIDRVISLAGINDLESYAQYGALPCGNYTVQKLVDLDNRSDPYHDTSPSELLPLNIPVVEIVAAFDRPVPPFFGRSYIEKAKQAGDEAKLILLKNAGHFEMIAPWSTEWKIVLEQFNK